MTIRKIITVIFVSLALAGCATVDNPDENVRAKAWSQVSKKTDLVVVGKNRVRITANGAFSSDMASMESLLLARAAGVALERGAPRFAVVHTQYNHEGVTRWIGSYEALMRARSDADISGNLNKPLGFKSATIVVRMLGDEEEADRQAFASEATYEALLNDRIEQKGIKPSRRLSIF